MLWFGITVMEKRVVISQEIHGPYDDTDALSDAVDERLAEIEDDGNKGIPLLFELCTDDVPEVVEYEESEG